MSANKRKFSRVFVTGGSGFIGSALIRYIHDTTRAEVLNFDKLTYASSSEALRHLEGSKRYRLVHGDIADKDALGKAVQDFKPDVFFNLAAESHVDRSIDGPAEFINTNLVGTFVVLEVLRGFLEQVATPHFTLLHVSTDEVFGSLAHPSEEQNADKLLFTEETKYDPSSPYSATKAGSDHLVRAWGRTYGLPVIISNCSNNYGPFQSPEKLIPLVIAKALKEHKIPIYGSGDQIRDWLFVGDHAEALWRIASSGSIGESYNLGGRNERQNIDLVRLICKLLDDLLPRTSGKAYEELIEHVTDRPGHDRRYAIDASKIEQELGWMPSETLDSGLLKTVEWYIQNPSWLFANEKILIRQGKG